MSMLDEALSYAARGWPVFPVQAAIPGDKTSGKRPIVANGFKEATTDARQIERWWARWPDANIGIPTGKKIGAFVIDVDGPRGSESLTDLEELLGPLPDTLEASTGGGGRHLFFKWQDGRDVTNRQHVVPGIDVRGEGGYVVAAPSVHFSGRPYAWLTTSADPAAVLGKSWLDKLAPPRAGPMAPWERVAPSAARPEALPVTALLVNGKLPLLERAKLYLREVDPAIQGSGGHNALLWAARTMVVGFELPPATALDLLWKEFNPPGLPRGTAPARRTPRAARPRTPSRARAPGSSAPSCR